MSPRKALTQISELTWVVRHLGRNTSGRIEFEMIPKDKRDDGPIVSFELADPQFPEQAQFRSVTIRAQENGRGLRTADLARINLDQILRLAYRAAAGGEQGEALYARSTKGGRPRVITQPLLEQVARIVAEQPERRRQAVAEAYGLSPRQASHYIAKARDAGLIKEVGSS